MVKKESNNTRLFIVLGILAIAIIFGSILGSKYMEKFTVTDKTLVYFYMNSCPFCNDFEPEWTKIEQIVNNKTTNRYTGLKLKKIDLQSTEGREYKEITGAPTIMALPSKNIYKGTREANPILEWIDGN
jgi:thiol-disulfide isomerase/thioredoxin